MQPWTSPMMSKGPESSSRAVAMSVVCATKAASASIRGGGELDGGGRDDLYVEAVGLYDLCQGVTATLELARHVRLAGANQTEALNLGVQRERHHAGVV